MIKAGILGGGQLGRMLLQEAANYPVLTHVMERDVDCPAAKLCHHFVKGDITAYDDVIRFGEGLDVLTIEIENVNVDALFALEAKGVKVIPRPAALQTIKNKILQKEFYQQHQIPTAPFKILNNRAELHANTGMLRTAWIWFGYSKIACHAAGPAQGGVEKGGKDENRLARHACMRKAKGKYGKCVHATPPPPPPNHPAPHRTTRVPSRNSPHRCSQRIRTDPTSTHHPRVHPCDAWCRTE